MRHVLQRYAAAAVAFLAIGLLVLLAGCGGGKQGDGRGGQPPGAAPACEAVRGKVESLYRGELARPPRADSAGDDAAKAAKAAEMIEREVADNTEMVLWDCRRAPDKFAPCLQGATSVAQIERECVFPLDDEGAVEGDLFGK